MNERDLERALIEWIGDLPAPSSGHVLDAVMDHATAHPRRSAWRWLPSLVLRALTGESGDRGDRLGSSLATGLATGLATAGAIGLIVMMAWVWFPRARRSWAIRPHPSSLGRLLEASGRRTQSGAARATCCFIRTPPR
jgi:hypothetical protein